MIMCGITAIFNIHDGAQALRKQALLMSKRIRHRGPDWSGIYQGKTAILAHERLSIVDPASGGQPLVSPDGKLILCVRDLQPSGITRTVKRRLRVPNRLRLRGDPRLIQEERD